ncbi:peptidoglycan recognition protein family protein [Paracoccus chinensis]|uniref:N-acetylmuramoyl-L-alanine amidase n=1 Tax=Paracoccus chinensis TaxID=525640 RepID=A0A1G9JJD2_9RHOB|nr:peptidoglycan recognition family protein [Paracoccus chinensis]SDL37521.1 N-acetylmuramoyl-L-alanine amidase [Paracoccus chinensis]
MKRIIIHWSAGGHTVSALDRQHYHYIVDDDGDVHAGIHPPEANRGPLVSGRYAAHTLNCNTGSIGVAFAAMAGAVERPFSAGRYPITPAQVDAMAALCAELCRQYNIPVSRKTVLTHAEVQPTLGITQRGKWDVTWLPGMSGPGAPVAVGDMLRARVLAELAPVPQVPTAPDEGTTLEDLVADVAALKARVAALEAPKEA